MINDRICGENCKDYSGNCIIPAEDGLPIQCVGPWVEDKYSFFERYLDATRLVRKKFSDQNNSVFIDLFAGPGRCIIRQKNREIQNGAMRVANNLKIPFSENYFFDINAPNIDALKGRIGKKPNYYFQCTDSNKMAEAFVESLLTKSYRYHFIYMDPFGPEALPFKTVKEFARLKRVDLFIHFPIGAIRRNLPHWRESDFGILDEFLGTSAWRDDIENLRQGKTLSKLLKIYEKQLFDSGFPMEGLRMASSDDIGFSSLPVVSVRNTQEVELYTLVLASKNGIAQKIWHSVIMIEPSGQRRLF